MDVWDQPVEDTKTETCPKCSSNDLHYGYGLAMGNIGSYTICLSCDHTFNLEPDQEVTDGEN